MLNCLQGTTSLVPACPHETCTRADAGASEEASGRTKRGAARPEAGKDALAGLSPSSNKERDNSSSAGATERGAPHAAVVFEYDPEYIERKCEFPDVNSRYECSISEECQSFKPDMKSSACRTEMTA